MCPFNRRFASPAQEARYAARGPGERPVGVEALGPARERTVGSGVAVHPGTTAPSLIELLEMALEEEAWDEYSRGSAMRRAGRAGFARNVCVGLGNWGATEAVPVLTAALADPEPLVRGHAAWALGRVGTEESSGALSARLATEADDSVLDEIRAALEP